MILEKFVRKCLTWVQENVFYKCLQKPDTKELTRGQTAKGDLILSDYTEGESELDDETAFFGCEDLHDKELFPKSIRPRANIPEAQEVTVSIEYLGPQNGLAKPGRRGKICAVNNLQVGFFDEKRTVARKCGDYCRTQVGGNSKLTLVGKVCHC
jgi:hypothetical protein